MIKILRSWDSSFPGCLFSERERRALWVAQAGLVFGLPERDLWDNIALGGDNVLLAIFIHVTRQYFRSDHSNWVALEVVLSKLDIRDALPTVHILKRIRHLYIKAPMPPLLRSLLPGYVVRLVGRF